MIEVSYLEYIRNTVKYTNAVIDRGEQVLIVRGGRKCLMIPDHTLALLKTAIDAAASAIDDEPKPFAVIDSA